MISWLPNVYSKLPFEAGATYFARVEALESQITSVESKVDSHFVFVVLVITALVSTFVFLGWSGEQAEAKKQEDEESSALPKAQSPQAGSGHGSSSDVEAGSNHGEHNIEVDIPKLQPDPPRTMRRKSVTVAIERCNSGFAFRRSLADADDEKFEVPDGYFEISAEDIIANMGLSGIALLDPEKSSGINGLPLKFSLPVIAAQAWTLQGIILYYMASQLNSRPLSIAVGSHGEKRLPWPIVFAAVYLHFIHCVTDLPFAIMVMRHIQEFHADVTHLLICGPIFAMDGLIIPVASLIIGSWYLCTSVTIGDVILNSCAVAFVSNIDNYILEMNARMNSMAGNIHRSAQENLYVPVNVKLVGTLNWLLCIIPIVPCLCAYGLVYVGIVFLHL